MKPIFYTLVDRIPVPTEQPMSQALADRRVGLTEVGPYTISTVFLGVDWRFFDAGPPLVFETAVFRDGEVVEQDRCSTWEEAEAMHARMVQLVAF